MGLGAVFVGSVLVYVTARTFTRPLEELVDGVRALGKGDFRYPVQARGASEIAELTNAFSGMRESLHQAQQRLLNAERLATIGRMASSISHDLRHPLTAVLANAEYGYRSHKTWGEAGVPGFAEMWRAGSGTRILADQAWLEANLDALQDAFLSGNAAKGVIEE